MKQYLTTFISFFLFFSPFIYGQEYNVSIEGIEENIIALSGSLPAPCVETFSGEMVAGTPLDGCSPLTNPNDLIGKIAVLDRGDCNFSKKILHAQDAGAIAVIICNNRPITEDGGGVLVMAGDGTESINLFAVMISQEQCATFRSHLPLTASFSEVRIDSLTPTNQVLWGNESGQGDFNGGLNGWTTATISCDGVSSTLDTWKYDPDGILDEGVLSTGNAPGPSFCNGMMAFDSDYLDNEGTILNSDGTINQGAVGTGPCPAPQIGELISPIIDISQSNVEGVSLEFHQETRQLNSLYYIQFSTDGGENYEEVAINTEIEGNEFNETNKTIIPLTGVKNASQLRVKFIYSGNYYYWLIDDVKIIAKEVINFEADTLIAKCVPFHVDFTNNSTLEAPITSWAWDFGDGNTSNLQHPTHIYNNFGNYSISLTVVDENGSRKTLTKNSYINILEGIHSRDTSICSGQTIDLNSLISGTPLNTLEYGTSFGIYDNSNIQTLVKTTTFFVRDSNRITNCSDTTKIIVTVNQQPNITGRDTTIMIGQSVDLSTLLNESILGSLDFGTMLGTYGLSNPISPITTQTYIIRDSIENNIGCKDTAKVVVNIPLANLSLVDIDGNGTPDITDPCNCFDPQNVRKSADGQTKVTLFHDFVIIHNGGIGQAWVLDVINAGAVLQKDGTPFSINTPLTDLGDGTYRLDFWHKPDIGFNASFRRLSDNATETIGNSCQEQACIIIPTFNQWGLLIFGLLILNLCLTIIYRVDSSTF